jgi:hypothetical protein
MDYETRLRAAYDEAFPRIRVSVTTKTTTIAGRRHVWSSQTALTCAVRLTSVPVLDHCLHRSTSKTTCVPHVICDCSAAGHLAAPSQGTLQSLAAGTKLTAGQKAELALLRRLPDRVLLTVAYAATRCLLCSHPYRRACVLLFFNAHANMVLLEVRGGVLEVTVYEPNGVAAARRYDTEAKLFPGFAKALTALLGRQAAVIFVGAGLQTLLGERSVLRRRGRVTIKQRGYPVCQAVNLWLFAAFLQDAEATETVGAFERRLLTTVGVEALREELLAWVEALRDWVREHQADALRKLLERTFADSNVVEVRAAYGRLQVRARPP